AMPSSVATSRAISCHDRGVLLVLIAIRTSRQHNAVQRTEPHARPETLREIGSEDANISNGPNISFQRNCRGSNWKESTMKSNSRQVTRPARDYGMQPAAAASPPRNPSNEGLDHVDLRLIDTF